MALEDATLEVIVKEGESCWEIVNKGSFSSCPPDMKRVYLFLISASLASLKQKRSGAGPWHIIGGGGIGAGIMAVVELYGRLRGWW